MLRGKRNHVTIEIMAAENKLSRGNWWKHERDVTLHNGRDSLIDIKVMGRIGNEVLL